MKEIFPKMMIRVGRVERAHIQLVVLALMLILFVLAGGAPVSNVNCTGC